MKVVVYAEYCKLSSVHMVPNFVNCFIISESFFLHGHFNGLGGILDTALQWIDVGHDHFHEVSHENCDACSATLSLHHHYVARAFLSEPVEVQ